MGKAHKKQESEEDPPEDLPAPPCPDPVVKPDDVQQDFYWCVFKWSFTTGGLSESLPAFSPLTFGKGLGLLYFYLVFWENAYLHPGRTTSPLKHMEYIEIVGMCVPDDITVQAMELEGKRSTWAWQGFFTCSTVSSLLLFFFRFIPLVANKQHQNAQPPVSSSSSSTCLPLCCPPPAGTPSCSGVGRMQTFRILELFALYEKCSFIFFFPR